MSDTGSNERKDFAAVGKSHIPGRLSHSLARGKARFGTDVVVPGIVCKYSTAQNQVFNARVRKVPHDTASAIKPTDPNWNLKPYREASL